MYLLSHTEKYHKTEFSTSQLIPECDKRIFSTSCYRKYHTFLEILSFFLFCIEGGYEAAKTKIKIISYNKKFSDMTEPCNKQYVNT